MTDLSPAPWRVEVDTFGNYQIAASPDDARVAVICSDLTIRQAAAISHDEAGANAAAIGALPELLAVCHRAVSGASDRELREMANAALNKAGQPTAYDDYEENNDS